MTEEQRQRYYWRKSIQEVGKNLMRQFPHNIETIKSDMKRFEELSMAGFDMAVSSRPYSVGHGLKEQPWSGPSPPMSAPLPMDYSVDVVPDEEDPLVLEHAA